MKIYGAVAYIHVEEDADRYAYKQGLFVLTFTSGDLVEILNNEKLSLVLTLPMLFILSSIIFLSFDIAMRQLILLDRITRLGYLVFRKYLQGKIGKH